MAVPLADALWLQAAERAAWADEEADEAAGEASGGEEEEEEEGRGGAGDGRVPSLVDLCLAGVAREAGRLLRPGQGPLRLPGHLCQRGLERAGAAAAWPECAEALARPGVRAVRLPVPAAAALARTAEALAAAGTLRRLELPGLEAPPSRAARDAVRALGSLRALVLRGAQVCAADVLGMCPRQLLELDVSYTPMVEGGGDDVVALLDVLGVCGGLRVLRASGAAGVSPASLLGGLLLQGARLRCVELNRCGPSHDQSPALPAPGDRPSMRALSLVGTPLRPAVLAAVAAACPGLEAVALQGHSRAGDSVLAPLCRTRAMRAFNAADSEAGEQTLEALREVSAGTLRGLNLGWCDGVAEGPLVALLDAAAGLRVLRLPCLDEAVGDAALLAASRHGRLRELSVPRCSRVTGEAVARVARACPHLRRVDLAWTGSVGDEHALVLLERCRSLEYLSLEGCKHVTDALLDGARRPPPSLRRLVFVYVDHVDAAAIERFLARCRRAEVVDYYGEVFRGADVPAY